MKIGMYAGTFDPIHKGHIEFAKEAIKQAGLDKIVIVAEKEPYRKKPHASWDHRQAMIERATETLEFIDHDYAFANQLAHKHTMKDMLSVASKHYGEENQFWFLVGSDVFEHLSEWKDIVLQEHYGGFVVAMKNDHTKEWLNEKMDSLQRQGLSLVVRIVDHAYSYASSSKIREISPGSQLSEYELDPVTTYISQHRLYR